MSRARAEVASAASTTPCLYDTYDAISFSAAGSAEHDPFAAESYTVFKNEITSDADAILDIPTADFFSLEASPAETPRRDDGEATPSAVASNGGGHASELAWFRAGSRFKSPMLQLHKEILDFCDFVSPTPEEQDSRAAAVQTIVEVVKYIWPHCKVEVFGSFRTGLYLPTSDIDVVILESNVRTPQTGLYALAKALSQRSIVKKLQVIAKTRVPIVKFVEKRSGIAFDISFDVESGPIAAEFIKNALKKMPPLRPLCLILKVFLHQRELNEVYSGGIGSYTLLAMLMAHLKMQWSNRDFQQGQQPMEHNLGILLVSFFEFYGRKLNISDVGVSCNSARTFFLKKVKGFLNTEQPYLLSIEDPQAPDNDIGRSSFNYFKVKSAFLMAYSLLTDVKTIISLGQQRSILGLIIRPDPLLLDRRGGINGELTFNTLLPGAGESALRELGEEKDMISNWQLLDDEPLSRENLSVGDVGILSSRERKSKVEKKLGRSEGHENKCRSGRWSG